MKKFILFISLFCFSTAFAQHEQELKKLHEEIDQLNKKVETLEKKEAKNAKLREFFNKHLKISGWAQLGFEWADQADKTSTFYVKRARIKISGDLYKDQLEYAVQADFWKSPKLLDVYVKYKPFKELNIQLGQFKLPFSLDNPDFNPLKLELIEYPMVIRQLVRFNDVCGVSATGRDLGAQLCGGFIHKDGYSIINYNLGAFTGAGINALDSNLTKDVVARVIIKPTRNLSFVGNYLWGEANTLNLVESTGKIDKTKYARTTRWGVGGLYDHKYFRIRTEYIAGKTSNLSSDGLYALFAYKFQKAPVNLITRYEFFRLDRDLVGADHKAAFGVDYHPLKFMRLQLNYTRSWYRESKRSNDINFMATFMF